VNFPQRMPVCLTILGLLSLSVAIAHSQELKKIRMGYPAFSLTFLTFFVAKDAGIYKNHGLDVDMVQLAGAVQTSALVAGEIDYLTGITSPLVAGVWKIWSAKPSPWTGWQRCKTSSPAIW
jgi:ABC-type nitrate/sulfonate/bicarbonate transport system substrate-binding protein